MTDPQGIGLPLDEAVVFWRRMYGATMSDDKFNKEYKYNIRHSYGQEGKRTNYAPKRYAFLSLSLLLSLLLRTSRSLFSLYVYDGDRLDAHCEMVSLGKVLQSAKGLAEIPSHPPLAAIGLPRQPTYTLSTRGLVDSLRSLANSQLSTNPNIQPTLNPRFSRMPIPSFLTRLSISIPYTDISPIRPFIPRIKRCNGSC